MNSLQSLNPERFDTPAILRQLNSATRSLAELKGVIASIPHQGILINTLGIQEAKDSSAIENIVTTHDELYREDAFPEVVTNAAAKEVSRYRQALTVGYKLVRETGLLTTNHLGAVQAELLGSNSGIRTMPGTTLRNADGQVVYTPPQDHSDVLRLLGDLERFINDSDEFSVDPLIKMALIHHQFESIHPFYDGNGRTGRILNVLYLVKESLLNIPVLYLSRPLMRTKGEYYRQLQAVREQDAWEAWVIYMLKAVDASAKDAVQTVNEISQALLATKHKIRAEQKFYSQDLINNLFSHPYTKIDFLEESLGVSRLTAAKYLDALASSGVLRKEKIGRSNYYINSALWAILAGTRMQSDSQ
jgi:Fic family protein